jgi:hypothetical protein
MTATVATVFAIVYIGMILGGLPFLQLDRTGVALLGDRDSRHGCDARHHRGMVRLEVMIKDAGIKAD